MAEINPPFALQNAGDTHTAANDRMNLGGLLAGVRASSSMVGRGGVNAIAGGAMAVSQLGSPAMGVQVASGQVYVAGTEGAIQGVYGCTNDGTVTLSLDAAHGSLPRIDLIVARVYDSAYSGADDEWVLEVVTGTAASSPSTPTAPANSEALASIAVAAAATTITNANITDLRKYVASAGGIISALSSAKPALNTVPEGQGIWLRDTGELQFKLSGAWVTRSLNADIGTWTPSWTSTGTAPNIATNGGSITGSYIRLGNVGMFWISHNFSSSSGLGTGSYRWSLPAGWNASLTNGHTCGSALMRDNSAALHTMGGIIPNAATTVEIRVQGDNVLNNSEPYPWASADFIRMTGQIVLA